MSELTIALQGRVENVRVIYPAWLYRRQRYEQLQNADTRTGFMTDYLSTRYISLQAGEEAYRVVKVLTALSNLLRTSEEAGITEIFLQSLKLKREGERWVIERR